jgi:hypothetical protein
MRYPSFKYLFFENENQTMPENTGEPVNYHELSRFWNGFATQTGGLILFMRAVMRQVLFLLLRLISGSGKKRTFQPGKTGTYTINRYTYCQTSYIYVLNCQINFKNYQQKIKIVHFIS